MAGTAGRVVEVPDVAGLVLARGIREIEGVGLTCHWFSHQPGQKYVRTIASQSPPAGARFVEGTRHPPDARNLSRLRCPKRARNIREGTSGVSPLGPPGCGSNGFPRQGGGVELRCSELRASSPSVSSGIGDGPSGHGEVIAGCANQCGMLLPMPAGVALRSLLAATVLMIACHGDGPPSSSAPVERSIVPWSYRPPEDGGATDTVPAAADPQRDLQAKMLQAPTTATAGQPLRFVISLGNPTGEAIRLEPCPVFFASFGESSTATFLRSQLDCQAAPSIASGDAAAFEISMDVPREPDFTIEGLVMSIHWRLWFEMPEVQANAGGVVMTGS